VTPKDLAKDSTQAVALDGGPNPLGNRQAQARVARGGTLDEKKLQEPARNAHPGCVALLEFPSLSKAVVAGERLPSDRA